MTDNKAKYDRYISELNEMVANSEDAELAQENIDHLKECYENGIAFEDAIISFAMTLVKFTPYSELDYSDITYPDDILDGLLNVKI